MTIPWFCDPVTFYWVERQYFCFYISNTWFVKGNLLSFSSYITKFCDNSQYFRLHPSDIGMEEVNLWCIYFLCFMPSSSVAESLAELLICASAAFTGIHKLHRESSYQSFSQTKKIWRNWNSMFLHEWSRNTY